MEETDEFIDLIRIMFDKVFHSKTRRSVVSAAINAAILLYFLFVFYCTFETDDDYAMKMIVSGAYGSPDSHIVYMNMLIGYLLKYLYEFLPSVSWYEIFHILITYFSLTAITSVLLDKKESSPMYLLLVFLVLFVSGRFFYVDLQFTKTASIATVCGYLLLNHSINKDSNKELFLSILFLFMAMLIRRRQFEAVSLVGATIFAPFLVKTYRELKNKQISTSFKKMALAVVLCTLFFVIVPKVNDLNYKDPAWSAYRTFNSSRAALLDLRVFSYEDDPSFFDGLGLSKIDIQILYDCWDFDDPEVFTTDTLKAILAHEVGSKDNIVNHIKPFVFDTFVFFFENRVNVIFVFVLDLLLIAFFSQERELLPDISFALTLCSMIFAFVYVYFYRNYALLGRVHLSIVLAAIFVLLNDIKIEPKNYKLISIIFSSVLIVISLSLFWFDDFRINSSKKVKDDLKIQAIKEINSDPGHLYLRTTDENLDYVSSLFIPKDAYARDNLYALGGWMTNMPLYNAVKEKFGVSNPFRDVVNNDDIFLIINSEEGKDLIIEYIRRHYDENANAQYVKSIQANKEYRVYKIVSSDD